MFRLTRSRLRPALTTVALATAAVTVTASPAAGAAPPSVTVESPAPDSTVAGPSVTLSGRFSDDVGVTRLTIGVQRRATGQWYHGDSWASSPLYLAVDRAPASGRSGTWTYAFRAPASGEYWAQVVITDTEGTRIGRAITFDVATSSGGGSGGGGSGGGSDGGSSSGGGGGGSGGSTTTYAVGSTSATFVDSARRRTLPTTILYPATSAGLNVPAANGTFPLVIAAHGAAGDGPGAAQLHQFLTRNGYVVAAPTYPSGFDFTNMAKDTSFVITSVLERSAASGNVLSGRIDRNRIGFIGTSMGGMIGLQLYQSCCVDARVDAVVAKIATSPGRSAMVSNGPALLMINGDADTTISYSDALAAYNRAPSPKGFIRLRGVGHNLNVSGSNILTEAPLGFFARYVNGDPQGLDRVVRAVNSTSIATLLSSWG